MTTDFQERRRSPRVALDRMCDLRASRRLRVRLLDVSDSGALLGADERLPVGAAGRLRLLLSGTPFEAAVEVKREEPASDGRGRVFGVVMVSVPAAQQDTLEEFLRRAGT